MKNTAELLARFSADAQDALRKALRADMNVALDALAGASDLRSMGRAQALYLTTKELLAAVTPPGDRQGTLP